MGYSAKVSARLIVGKTEFAVAKTNGKQIYLAHQPSIREQVYYLVGTIAILEVTVDDDVSSNEILLVSYSDGVVSYRRTAELTTTP